MIAAPHLHHVPEAPWRELAQKIQAVVPVGPRHGVLKKVISAQT
jgi:hypothetical protein